MTALGRSIDPRHPASAWVLVAASAVLLASGLEHGWQSGIRGAIAVIIAWAIVRELAPLRAMPSLLAPVAAVAYAIPAETDLLACVGVLLATRVTVRSVGDLPTLLDCAVLVVLGGWMATRPEALPAALVLAAATFASGAALRLRAAGLVMLVAVLAIGIAEGSLTPDVAGWADRITAGRVLVVLAAACALHLVLTRLPARLRARDDRDRGHLLGSRVRAARIVAALCVLATAAWIGVDAVFVLSCACAGIVAAAVGSARLPAASDTLAA